MLPRATAELYRANQRRSLALLRLVRDWQGTTSPRLVAAVSAAMSGAGDDGWRATTAALTQQGVTVTPDGQMSPGVFGTSASDGRPLGGLLVYAETVAEETPGGRAQRLQSGRDWLEMVVRTQIADAARGGSSLGVVARDGVGWVRMVNAPSCQRCAVLAGRVYRYSEGFQRHPRCDCLNVPTLLGAKPGYMADIKPGDVKDLTIAQRQAVDDGADLNQVINAHRKGARSSDGMTTSEGTTRGGAGRRAMTSAGLSSRAARLTPEAIYRVTSTREEAVSLLRRYGYLL